jgi:hypothetical protein
MSVASLFEPVQGYDRSQVVRLVEKLIKSAREDFVRLKEYESEFSPTLTDGKDDQAALPVLRSIWELWEQWAREAETLVSRFRELQSAGHDVAGIDGLLDDFSFAQARLKMHPENHVTAMQQIRRGEAVAAEGLRNELRRRRGA